MTVNLTKIVRPCLHKYFEVIWGHKKLVYYFNMAVVDTATCKTRDSQGKQTRWFGITA